MTSASKVSAFALWDEGTTSSRPSRRRDFTSFSGRTTVAAGLARRRGLEHDDVGGGHWGGGGKVGGGEEAGEDAVHFETKLGDQLIEELVAALFAEVLVA